MNRVAGLETEYGCLSQDPSGATPAVARVRSWIFDRAGLGLVDVFPRDWDEPAGNGGFLFNGGRAYIDMGHLEYCTPECLDLMDVVRYDRAGDLILMRALAGLQMEGAASFVRNNIDHYTGATFGCHENYLVRRKAVFGERNLQSLLAFLTLRMLYTGSGRVGASAGAAQRGDLAQPGSDPHFQISQRADYIHNDLFEWVQFNRAIINTRDEPLADPTLYRRLHLLHGDTNVLASSLALKVGTTSLMLDLLEMGCLPGVGLANPVGTFRWLSHHPEGPWRVEVLDGVERPATEVLREFHGAAMAHLSGRDAETDQLLRTWGEVLAGLETEPMSLVGRVDWVTKWWLLGQFVEREGISWADPWLRSQDLEYHQIDPDRGLGWGLADLSDPWNAAAGWEEGAMLRPPSNTRANARSRLMVEARDRGLRCTVDWEVVDAEGRTPLSLLDPFDPWPPEARDWMEPPPPPFSR